MTLTQGQGHLSLHLFKGLATKYLWAKFHNSTVNEAVHTVGLTGLTNLVQLFTLYNPVNPVAEVG